MLATTVDTRITVRRVARLTDAPARQARRYEGKQWRPDSAIIEYALYPGGWEAVNVTLTGRVLKRNGEASVRRYPAETQFAWAADPGMRRLVDILRPSADGGSLTFTALADYDLSKES